VNFYTVKLRLMLVPLVVEGEVPELAEELEEEVYKAA